MGGEGGEAEEFWAALKKRAQGGWRRYGWGCKFGGLESFHARGQHGVSAAGMFANLRQLQKTSKECKDAVGSGQAFREWLFLFLLFKVC